MFMIYDDLCYAMRHGGDVSSQVFILAKHYNFKLRSKLYFDSMSMFRLILFNDCKLH